MSRHDSPVTIPHVSGTVGVTLHVVITTAVVVGVAGRGVRRGSSGGSSLPPRSSFFGCVSVSVFVSVSSVFVSVSSVSVLVASSVKRVWSSSDSVASSASLSSCNNAAKRWQISKKKNRASAKVTKDTVKPQLFDSAFFPFSPFLSVFVMSNVPDADGRWEGSMLVHARVSCSNSEGHSEGVRAFSSSGRNTALN